MPKNQEVKFKRGPASTIPSEIDPGSFLIETDSGNMFGALEYSLAASKEGIQPIIGSELLMEASKFFDKADADG